MFDSARQKIGMMITRLFLHKKSSNSISFSGLFTSARTALVIVPENAHHRSMALPMLMLLQNKFQGNRLTLIVNEIHRELANTFSRSTIVPVTKEHLNFFYLPKKTSFERIVNQKYDIVVDLNLSLVPVGAYFMRKTNALLKVGFTQQHADAYYNFQFNSAPNRPAKSRYEQLFRTLSMF